MFKWLPLFIFIANPAIAEPPPKDSPDWNLTHKDSTAIENSWSVSNSHCCGVADGRPVNDNGLRFNIKKHHYEVRFNIKRWEAGTVSQTPPEPEPGDTWLEVQPGILTFDYQPQAFTEVWISHWENYENNIMKVDQSLLCITVKGGV